MSSPAAPTHRFTLLADTEVEALPDPAWQVDQVIPAGALVCLYGPPGDGKSLLTLSLAFSVGTGRRWAGRPVRRGGALIVAAEGAGGLKSRMRALKYANLHDGSAGMYFLPSPVYLHDPLHVHAFCDAVEASLPDRPTLVVFDTLARCMVGADENSVRDVGQAIAGADYVRQRFAATVMLVHHSQKAGELERGSSALRAAADTMLALKSDDGQLTLEVTKQKDGLLGDRIALLIHPVLDSCVVVTPDRVPASPTTLSRRCHDLLAAFDAVAIDGTTSAAVWLESSAAPKRTFYRSVKTLVDGGYVEKKAKVGYRLTDRGAGALVPGANEVSSKCHGSDGAKVPPVCRPFRAGTNDTAPVTPPPEELPLESPAPTAGATR